MERRQLDIQFLDLMLGWWRYSLEMMALWTSNSSNIPDFGGSFTVDSWSLNSTGAGGHRWFAFHAPWWPQLSHQRRLDVAKFGLLTWKMGFCAASSWCSTNGRGLQTIRDTQKGLGTQNTLIYHQLVFVYKSSIFMGISWYIGISPMTDPGQAWLPWNIWSSWQSFRTALALLIVNLIHWQQCRIRRKAGRRGENLRYKGHDWHLLAQLNWRLLRYSVFQGSLCMSFSMPWRYGKPAEGAEGPLNPDGFGQIPSIELVVTICYI